MVCSREMEQFCIMILVMVQKPVPVIKFQSIKKSAYKANISDYHMYFSNTLSISIF